MQKDLSRRLIEATVHRALDRGSTRPTGPPATLWIWGWRLPGGRSGGSC